MKKGSELSSDTKKCFNYKYFSIFIKCLILLAAFLTVLNQVIMKRAWQPAWVEAKRVTDKLEGYSLDF